jgi:hypothetical protein
VTDEMGWNILLPGVEGMLRFVWRRTTDEWVGDFRSSGDPPSCEAWLVVKYGLGTIKDKCKFICGSSRIGPANVPEGWVLLGVSSSSRLSEAVAECVGKFEFVEREYLLRGSDGHDAQEAGPPATKTSSKPVPSDVKTVHHVTQHLRTPTG